MLEDVLIPTGLVLSIAAARTAFTVHGSWTMERPNELALYGKAFGTAQSEIRWDLVAQGLGCHSEDVDQIEDL